MDRIYYMSDEWLTIQEIIKKIFRVINSKNPRRIKLYGNTKDTFNTHKPNYIHKGFKKEK